MSEHKNETNAATKSGIKLEYNDLFERFLHFFISTFFSLLCFLLISSTTAYTEMFFEPGNVIFCLVMTIVTGLFYQAVLDFFYATDTKDVFHARVFVLWLVISIVLCFVLKMDFAPYFLIPAQIVQYVITVMLNRILVYQNAFLWQINDWNGNDLATNLRNDYDRVEKLNKSIDKNKILLYILGLIVFLCTGIMFKFGDIKEYPFIKIAIVICYVLFFAALFITFVLYNVYQKNTYYAFLGFKTALSRKRSVIKTVLIILGVSIAFGFIFSSNSSLISFSPKPREVKDVPAAQFQPPPVKEWDPGPSVKAMQDALGRDMPVHPLAEFFWKFLTVAFIAGLAGLVIYFIWHFIFSETFFKLFTTNLIFQIIAQFFRNIQKFFEGLFSHKSELQEYTTVNSREFKHNMDWMIRKSKRTTKKKEELDRLTKKFMQLIACGEKHGIKYRNTMAAGDYSELFQNYLNENDLDKENIAIRVGYIFEKALYSNELISTDEEKEFNEKLSIINEQL